MNLHTYVCFVYDVVHHFNNIILGVEPRWKEKREERQGCKYFNASCVTFLTFEIDAAGKYISPKNLLFNYTICVSLQIDLEQFCT